MNKIIRISFVLIIFVVSCAFAENAPLDNNAEFIDKLESCQPYIGEFKHPYTGEILKREVMGQGEGKCLYIEEIPSGEKMECKFSEAQRSAVTEYYRARFSNKIQDEKGSLKNGITKSTYTVDGAEVNNPLQECLSSGACVISRAVRPR